MAGLLSKVFDMSGERVDNALDRGEAQIDDGMTRAELMESRTDGRGEGRVDAADSRRGDSCAELPSRNRFPVTMLTPLVLRGARPGRRGWLTSTGGPTAI